ncbi:hydroxymethylpyrimidine ABC transporter, transmembrane component [Paenibacillus sp. JCM 10914]|nr:hydroxymethylpyrimidine ABC transporter, transmembrane component [Paenibacillus sp. JCM 10914]
MKSMWSSIWPPVVAVIFLLTVWQTAVWLFDIEPFILPPPSAIGLEAINGASGLMQHTLATLQLTLVGFTIGTATAGSFTDAAHHTFLEDSPLSAAYS